MSNFLRTHSHIVNGVVNSKPVSITEKVVDWKKKDKLLQAQKFKKIGKGNPPLFNNSTGTHSSG